jgi:hypothetical protein
MSTLTVKKQHAADVQAMRNPIEKVSSELQELLGQKLTAYLAGLKDPKVVGLWAKKKAVPRDLPARRLRCAYQAALLLNDAYGPETTKSWFFGTNTRLDDEAPAYLLRHGKTPDDLRMIVPAAKAFVTSAA